MVIKLVVLATAVIVANAGYLGFPNSAGYLGLPVGYNVGYGFASPSAPAVSVYRALAHTNESKIHADPIVIAVHDNHLTFLDKIEVLPPFYYSYGYEVTDSNRGFTHSQYESRYGDVAVGTYIKIESDGSRCTVDYTADTPNGFNAIVRKDFIAESAFKGYARLAAPLAYASHPVPEVYASHATVHTIPDTLHKSGPLGRSAYKAHIAFLKHFKIEPPFKYSFGYELYEARTGRTKSQYESHYGNSGEGNYALVEAGVNRRSIDYIIDENGFAVATQVAYASDAIPLVYV